MTDDVSEPPLPLLLDAVLSVGTELELRATLQHIVDSATRLTGAVHGVLRVTAATDGGQPDVFTSGEASPPGGLPADLSIPILVHDEEFGTLHLTAGAGGGFSGSDLGLLRVLAGQAGIAVGNARLYETARQRERWIEGAAAVTTALLTGEAAADALMTVAQQARRLAGAAAGVVLQPTPEGGMSIVAAATDAAGGTLPPGRRSHPAAAAQNDMIGTTIEPGSAVLEQLLGGEPVFIEDSATDPRMTTHVRSRFGPSMMLPLQAGGRLIGTLALPRRRGERPYTAVERLLATQFASQAALALVLADAQQSRQRLAVFEDRDRIARDLHDLVVQRLFATGMMLESTRRRAGSAPEQTALDQAVDELESTIQEVRTAIFALQQPPADAPTTFRGKVLKETAGAAALLGVQPSVHFTGAVDTRVADPAAGHLLAALRRALAAASRRTGVTRVDVTVDAGVGLPDGRTGVRLVVFDDGSTEDAGAGTTVTWQAPL
ncbi:GAF domain-containing protein [Streptomyces aurantiacus]|uniref:Putative Redox sensor histidine kinase response regulator DevS n=1 Tax=Streptomyces aurantiacus JA 4570 TaxID=1286094 RepID=S3ZIJ7_9ACTN|nr:GAF domain-containing protein [Streptomyces aurantiacus]EPH42504.1 putative Redox sensor histidine kinase response regulator DevS [Streptomyces aurantiacus JA 4570]